MKKTRIAGSLFAMLLIGVGLGWYVAEGRERICLHRYEFINAPIACEHADSIKKTGYVDTQNKIAAFVEDERSAGRITDVSVYFRDLEHGPVFGIDEYKDFAPASLLKLPLAMVYLTWAEREPEILARKIAYTNTQLHIPQMFPPKDPVTVGNEYSVEDLLTRMVAHSDNAAYDALLGYLEEIGETNRIFETFNEIGIIGAEAAPEDILSVRRYAGIFRALYNVSFLNPELSEKVLRWLTEAQFDQGLVAGVPSEIQVAHKFGEREYTEGAKQLHDCGIIYFPGNPYLLCIMTRGNDLEALSNVIQKISRMVYEEVDSRRL